MNATLGARMDNLSAGEVGGVVAGVLAVLAAIGGGIRWVFGVGASQAKLQAAKLGKWEENLLAREILYRQTIERELGQVRVEVATMRREHAREIAAQRKDHAETRSVLLEVTVELQVLAPHNEALARAHKNLSLAFPLDHELPGSVTTMVDHVVAKHQEDEK